MKSDSSLLRLAAFLLRAILPLTLALSAPALCAGTSSPITISPATIAPLSTNNPYTQAFTATGGTAPYTWSTPVVALPAGLSLDASPGIVSGTPTAAGNAVIFLRVTDSVGLSTQRGWNVPITVGTPRTNNPPSTDSGPSVPPTQDPPTFVLTVVHGTANGVSSGSFAAGTTISLAAVPAPAGHVFANWTGAAVSNANAATTTLNMPAADTTVTANYTVAGAPAPRAIAPATPPVVTAGVPYSYALSISGGTSPYTCTVAAGRSRPASPSATLESFPAQSPRVTRGFIPIARAVTACPCAAISCGRSWTTSSGARATTSASACVTPTTRRKNARPS